jgi:SAM-dependent methyltransferase
MGLRERLGTDRWRERARAFGPAAQLYDRIRPSYPVEAIHWALAPLGDGRIRVADVGAGTGIMTRQLVALGHEVVAVEPDDGMRATLAQATPVVTAVSGSAESVPLPDSSVDAVVAAQAYHWFDRGRAHPELARVIRPGGVLVVVWNNRDESTDWVAQYSSIIERDRGGPSADHGVPPDFGPWFAPAETSHFSHTTRHDADSLVTLMMSRSYFITATPARQAELERQVRELAAGHPDMAGRPEFELPYETLVHRTVRLNLPAAAAASGA